MPRFVTCVRCHSTHGEFDASGLCDACRSRAGQSAVPTPLGDDPTSAAPVEPNATTRIDPFADPGATATADGLTAAVLPPETLTFANYVLHEMIGRGGMGIVYRATQRVANRIVALKIMAGATEFDNRLKERFHTEAEAQARLRHPDIVPIYEVGEENGRPFFSMEFVPGGSLARRMRNGHRPGPRESAAICATVARAVAAAHAEAVIHRDVKPSNILLTADGSPKVTDFGLAVLADRDSRVTSSGALLGTPSYMAPEQAAGKKDQIGPPTDVYAIGATLYELLTGEPPFRAETNVATAVKVLNDPVVPPRKRNPVVSPELDAVCLKCLEKAPANRYASAAALADDLDAWREGKPTVARPLTVTQKAGRLLKRYRVALAAVVFLPLLAGALYLATREKDPKDKIEEAFANGNEVTLIGATGGPKWQKWVYGEVPIDYTLSDEGCFAFQTHVKSEITLLANPRQDEYHIIAEVKHLRAKDPTAYCGVYSYSGYSVQTGDLTLRRMLRATYSEFNVNPNAPATGLKIVDESSLTNGLRMLQQQTFLPGIRFFGKNAVNQSPWRTIVLSATRYGLEVYLKTDTGYSLAPPPKVPGVPEENRIKHHRDLVQQYGSDLPLPPVWIHRGPVGLTVYNGAAAFRNVVIKPGPFVAP
jgi:serine/threonine-protein kinase